MLMAFTAECQNDLEHVCEDSPTKTSTVYFPMLVKNYNQFSQFEVKGYELSKICKLIAITYDSNIQYFQKNYKLKPMFVTKTLQLIDKNPDIFKDWSCGINCLKVPWGCKNFNPVSRNMCYYLYKLN